MRRVGIAPILGAFLALGTLAPNSEAQELSGIALVPVAAGLRPLDPALSLPADPPAALPASLALPQAPPADAPPPETGAGLGPLGLPCTASLGAKAAPGGAALIRIEAPCHANAQVAVSHGGLTVDLLTSNTGVAEALFPAFEDRARYEARFPGGARLSAVAEVPGASGYERVITMWRGESALAVHAYEFGAAPGEAGHVWRGEPSAASASEAGRGGYHLALGSARLAEGRRAEIYSFPAALSAKDGAVRIVLAAEAGPGACGTDFRATTLQLGEGLPGAPVGLSVALPPCGSEQTAIVLKNIARDLMIAAQ